LSYLEKKLNASTPLISTSTSEALHQIAESIHKRSLVIIFSDMFEQSENQDALFASLQHLKHNKHEVILFHVTDKSKEIDFDYEDRPYLFVDMETGSEVKLQAGLIKEIYKEKTAGMLKDLKMKCLQYKIDFVEADIKEGFHQVLQNYLVKRSKMKVG
jgi:type IV secretory pathway VirJ component